MALALSLLGVGIAAWYHPAGSLFAKAVVGSVAGGGASGALIGWLSPLSRWPLSTMLVGAVAGSVAFAAMMFAVSGFEGAAPTAQLIWVSVGAGAPLGSALALSVKYAPLWRRLRAA